MAKDKCSICDGAVTRVAKSKPLIVCQPCRREHPQRSKRKTKPLLTCSLCRRPMFGGMKNRALLQPGVCMGCRKAMAPPPPAVKPCRTCGQVTPTPRHHYCEGCRKRPQMPGRTTAQGYGFPHQRERQRLVPLVAQGGYVCTRYGHPQFPNCPGEILPGDEWELGHDDTDKRVYSGPEHARCNERAGGLKRQGLLEDGVSSLQW